MLEIQEPINVVVFFKDGAIQPLLFFWKSRRIKVDAVNLIHTSKAGSNLFYHFSISAQGNFYRLQLDVGKMSWKLEEVEEE